MTTSAQRMRRLRERRTTRLAAVLPPALPGLADGDLLDMLAVTYQHGYLNDFEAAAAELARRIKVRRAGSHAVTVTIQQTDNARGARLGCMPTS
ncbi:MAG: hypothetical protein ACOYB3_11525 [Azonexus sp.]